MSKGATHLLRGHRARSWLTLLLLVLLVVAMGWLLATAVRAQAGTLVQNQHANQLVRQGEAAPALAPDVAAVQAISPTATPTATRPSPTATTPPTAAPTSTPAPSATPVPAETLTPTVTLTATPTLRPSRTPWPTATATATPWPTVPPWLREPLVGDRQAPYLVLLVAAGLAALAWRRLRI